MYVPQIISGVFTAVILWAFGSVTKKQKMIIKQYKALQDGVRSTLRSEIIRDHGHYMDKGYIPVYAMENVLESYDAYHALGGNGTITKMVGELRELPTRRER